MTDLEITKRCAEKEGRTVRGFSAKSAVCFDVSDSAIVASNSHGGDDIYDPLTNDAQAFALVKCHNISIGQTIESGILMWHAYSPFDGIIVADDDLNRAICECVAKLPD